MIFGNKIVAHEHWYDYKKIKEIDEFVEEFKNDLLKSEERHKKVIINSILLHLFL